EHSCRGEAGKRHQVDRGLGVPGPAQDPAGDRPQRKHVPGPAQVLRTGGGVHERANGGRPVMRRDPGRDLVLGADRDRKGGALVRSVLLHHLRQGERVQPLAGHRHGDEAAGLLHHEVDRLGRHPVRRHDQVPFVFAGLVVHHDDESARANGLRRFGNLSERDRLLLPGAHGLLLRGGASGAYAASSRSTYLARTSASRFTIAPGRTMPSVVTAHVWGIRHTVNRSPAVPATVRLTPSTATDPLSTMYRATGAGASISIHQSSPRRSRPVMRPTPSTWPCTTCPPRRSPTATARSTFTTSPTSQRPSVVRATVSPVRSASKRLPAIRVTVRHVPLTAMLSPTRTPSRAHRASTLNRSDPSPGRTARTTPVASTMPVNIARDPPQPGPSRTPDPTAAGRGTPRRPRPVPSGGRRSA